MVAVAIVQLRDPSIVFGTVGGAQIEAIAFDKMLPEGIMGRHLEDTDEELLLPLR